MVTSTFLPSIWTSLTSPKATISLEKPGYLTLASADLMISSVIMGKCLVCLGRNLGEILDFWRIDFCFCFFDGSVDVIRTIMKVVYLFLMMVVGVFGAGVKSGKAEVELKVKGAVVAVYLRAEKGWHSYWKNPGEMGLATSVKWDVPEGVVVEELKFPVPHLFVSGDTKSFGYEDAEVLVDFEIGKVASLSADASLIEKAEAELPTMADGWKAEHSVSGKNFILKLVVPDGVEVGKADLYVSQENIVGVGEKVIWTQKGRELVGEVGVSEYFNQLPKELEVILDKGDLKGSVSLVSCLLK